jgi:hypothetical protein
MPVPTPRNKEEKDKFISRCVSFLHKEESNKPKDKRRPNEQLVAICFSQWKNKSSKSSEEVEIDEATSEFVNKFLTKHPEYASYFDED